MKAPWMSEMVKMATVVIWPWALMEHSLSLGPKTWDKKTKTSNTIKYAQNTEYRFPSLKEAPLHHHPNFLIESTDPWRVFGESKSYMFKEKVVFWYFIFASLGHLIFSLWQLDEVWYPVKVRVTIPCDWSVVRWSPIICQHSPLIMSYSSPSRTSGVCLVAFSRISCKKDKLDVYVLVLFKIFGSDRSPRRGDLVRACVCVALSSKEHCKWVSEAF